MTSFIKAFLVALIGSIAGNLIVLFLLRPLVIDPAMPLHALSVMPVAMLTTIGIVGATIVYALMRAFLTRPNKPFVIVSAVVLLASFVPDYLIIGQTTGGFVGATLQAALVLMLMHVVAAAVTVYALMKLWGARRA